MTEFPDIRFKKTTGIDSKNDWFEVAEDCKCRGGVVIPKGYNTDFASVPRLLWSIFPPHGFMANAAVLHDYMYDNKVGQNIWGEWQARKIADELFLVNCIEDNVPVWQSTLMYYIIRLFGRKWWIK